MGHASESLQSCASTPKHHIVKMHSLSHTCLAFPETQAGNKASASASTNAGPCSRGLDPLKASSKYGRQISVGEFGLLPRGAHTQAQAQAAVPVEHGPRVTTLVPVVREHLTLGVHHLQLHHLLEEKMLLKMSVVAQTLTRMEVVPAKRMWWKEITGTTQKCNMSSVERNEVAKFDPLVIPLPFSKCLTHFPLSALT